MERLDFEQPIVELEEQLNKAIQLGKDNDADVTKIVSEHNGTSVFNSSKNGAKVEITFPKYT